MKTSSTSPLSPVRRILLVVAVTLVLLAAGFAFGRGLATLGDDLTVGLVSMLGGLAVAAAAARAAMSTACATPGNA